MPATARVRLWTLAEAAVWERLRAAGSLRVDPALISYPEWLPQYDWLRGQMARRLADYSGGYPWWAWAWPKPDLRETRHHWGRRGDSLVRLALAVPVADVLCFDFATWSFPLNDHPAWLSEAEAAAWDALPERARTRAAKEATWDRLLDPDATFDPAWVGQLETVQAVFETLRLADVTGVTPFRSRVAAWGEARGNDAGAGR
jgi:hypothetical protein